MEWYGLLGVVVMAALFGLFAANWLITRQWYQAVLACPNTKPVDLGATAEQLTDLLQGRDLRVLLKAACSVMIAQHRMVLLRGPTQSIFVGEYVTEVGFTTTMVMTLDQAATGFALSRPGIFRRIVVADGKAVFWLKSRRQFLIGVKNNPPANP